MSVLLGVAVLFVVVLIQTGLWYRRRKKPYDLLIEGIPVRIDPVENSVQITRGPVTPERIAAVEDWIRKHPDLEAASASWRILGKL